MPLSRPLLLRRLLCNSLFAALLIACTTRQCAAQDKQPGFRVIALAEHGGIHQPFVDAAKIWLAKFAAENNFTVDYIEDTAKINDDFLARYNLFIQLNYPPYNWTDTAKAAFIKYIEEGRGGWIGFHHATLLGEFDGYPIWPWFRDFMGGIRFKSYISTFVTGMVTVEVASHASVVVVGLSGRCTSTHARSVVNATGRARTALASDPRRIVRGPTGAYHLHTEAMSTSNESGVAAKSRA